MSVKHMSIAGVSSSSASTPPDMKARDVPKALRVSLAETRALEEGERAGRAGVAAGLNPWRAEGAARKPPVAFTGFGFAVHAGNIVTQRTYCGAQSVSAFTVATVDVTCKSCVRAVEAERKRLEAAWERGRQSTHPK